MWPPLPPNMRRLNFHILPAEGSEEGLSPALDDSNELTGHGESWLVEFSEALMVVSIL